MAYRRVNCSLILIALMAVAVLSPALFTNRVQAPSGEPWWDTNWQYRKSIQIDNTLNSRALTDYPVSIAFDAGSLISAGKMKSDLGDLRFYDPDSSTVLNYWIESMPTPDQPASPDVMNWKYPSNPLSIPTYGYTDTVHPKVLYFPSGYDGYKYWMFYEPVGAVEVLVLVRSNDGITWTDAGVPIPLLPNGPGGSFDSWACADPDVVIVSGTWYLFFDGSNGSADRIGMATSTDGLHWTKFDRDSDGVEDPVLSSDVNFVAPDGHKYESADLFLSPTAYHDGTRFWLWLGSGEGTRASHVVRTMLFSCADPTGTWTRENNAEPVLSPDQGWEGNMIWHIEVSKHGSEFWMYYSAPNTGSIGFAESTDKVTWTKSTRNPILTRVSGTWEGSHLYRSSCIEVGGEIWLYYSAYGIYNGRIGLAKALPSAGNPNAVIQVKIPSILAGSTKTIYMYYGNPSASATSNGDNTFSFFDDFNDNSLNSTKWQTGSGAVSGSPIGSVSETNQRLEINEKSSSGGAWTDLYTVTRTSFDFSNGMSFKVFLENLDTGERAAVIDLIPVSTTTDFLFNQPLWIRFMIYAGLYYLQIRYPGPTSPSNPKVIKTTSAAGDLNRVVEIQIDGTRLRCLLDGVVWADWYTHSLTWHSAYAYLEQSTGSANSFTTVHDNIVVRNCFPPDPTASVGSEEVRGFDLTVAVSGHGTTDPSPGVYTLDVDSQQIVTAVPDAGYKLDHWDLDGENVGSSLSYTVTMDEEHTLTALFVPSAQTYINPQLTEKTIDDVGESFKVDVTITGVTDLRGFDFNVTWENSLLTLASVDYTTTLNNIWGSGNWECPVEQSGAGYYKLVAVSTANSFTSTGPTPLYELTFTVQDPQSNFPRQTPIQFDTHKLSDSQADPIPNTVSDGTYTISGETPTLQMSPTSKTCRKYGETFTVSIAVSNEFDVTDFEFEIHYNTTLLDYASRTWDAWGSGTITVNEADGIITGSTSGGAINGPRTLVTIQFSAAYHRIWKDESKIPGWKNDQSGVIYIQSAKLSYPSSPDLSYVRGGTQNQISVGPEVAYTFSPIQGDIDNNGSVDVTDLRTVAVYFDQANSTYDLNGNGVIDIFDLVLIGANFWYTYIP